MKKKRNKQKSQTSDQKPNKSQKRPLERASLSPLRKGQRLNTTETKMLQNADFSRWGKKGSTPSAKEQITKQLQVTQRASQAWMQAPPEQMRPKYRNYPTTCIPPHFSPFSMKWVNFSPCYANWIGCTFLPLVGNAWIKDINEHDHRLISNISQWWMYMREAHPIKHMIQMQSMIQRCWEWYVTQMKHAKCICTWDAQPKFKKDTPHQVHLANEKMYLGPKVL
jgi:hypothetical protein